MVVGRAEDIADEVIVHRIGGASLGNLQLSPLDRTVNPSGISVLRNGTPQESAEQMRKAFPKSRKWASPQTVATANAGQIRAVGFEIVPDATNRFPNHARVIHPNGETSFNDPNLTELAKVFRETKGC